MRSDFRALLACPACRASLDPNWHCTSCGGRYAAPDGIPALRLQGTDRTEIVRDFYTAAPFPGYPPNDSLAWLRSRAERSSFARLLDEAIPGDARIAEIGCGTGQMSLYLARADRIVIGADLTRASLMLGAEAAGRFRNDRLLFVETDIARAGLCPGAFDVVYCSGVLHHTSDPGANFRRVVELARPGGMIILGLYNRFARIPLMLRRLVGRLTRGRWMPEDPVLTDRAAEPTRREAWLRDQYHHPEEHRHSLGEIRRWFAENDVQYVRAFPSALIAEEPEGLFEPEDDDWQIEALLAQLSWMWSVGREGGLFLTVGKRAGATSGHSLR